MGRDCKFQQKWIDKREVPWPQRVRDSVHHAFCTFCSSKFTIRNGGFSSVTAHQKTETHQKKEKRTSESKTIVASADTNEIQVSDQPAVRSLDDVLAAEVLQAFNVVDKNQLMVITNGWPGNFMTQT